MLGEWEVHSYTIIPSHASNVVFEGIAVKFIGNYDVSLSLWSSIVIILKLNGSIEGERWQEILPTLMSTYGIVRVTSWKLWSTILRSLSSCSYPLPTFHSWVQSFWEHVSWSWELLGSSKEVARLVAWPICIRNGCQNHRISIAKHDKYDALQNIRWLLLPL